MGCLQAAGPPADNDNFFRLWGVLHLAPFQFAPNDGVYRAAPCGCCRPFSHAGEAAEAFYNILCLACHGFPGQEGVCEERPCHIHNVRFPAGNNFFHLLGVVQAADGCYGDGHMLFDFCCKVHIAAMLLEHRWMRVAEAPLVCTG